MPKVPPPGKRIQKGERRNPNGSSAKARARAAARKLGAMLTPEELALATAALFMGTPEHLRQRHDDPSSSVLEKLLARLIMQAYEKKDGNLAKMLMEQVVGKPRERKTHEISGLNGRAIEVSKMPDAEIEAELAALRRARQLAE